MVTNKTTKALSLVLPIALLTSISMNAMDSETKTTGSRVLSFAKNIGFIALGAGLARGVQARLSTVAQVQKAPASAVAFTVDATGKNIVDQNGTVVVALNANGNAANAGAVNQALAAKGDVSTFVDAANLTDAVKAKLATAGNAIPATTTGYREAFKTNFLTNVNPFKKCANGGCLTNTTNLVKNHAPALAAVALITSGVCGLVEDVKDLVNGDAEAAE